MSSLHAVPAPVKYCKGCDKSLELSRFGSDSKSKDGFRYWCRPCEISYTKEWRLANPVKTQDYNRKASLKSTYGLSVEQYNDMFVAQGGRCAICKKHQSEFKRRFAVDHDHETGVVRELLCTKCNPGIGYFKDNPENLRQAALYLEMHNK